MAERRREEKEFDLSTVIGGKLSLFGLEIDLGKLLSAPEQIAGQLEGLREALLRAGGREALSTEEWRRGGASVSGHVRLRGLQGDQEYHIGTSAGLSPRPRGRSPEQPLVTEPPLDIFQEERELVIVAEVPGVELKDLVLTVANESFSLATRPGSPRQYRKTVHLGCPVESTSLQATCRNGILEARLQKTAE